ncbi:hypothetical protein BC831DRAFT_460540, partial [Entophlyctis helioformis]
PCTHHPSHPSHHQQPTASSEQPAVLRSSSPQAQPLQPALLHSAAALQCQTCVSRSLMPHSLRNQQQPVAAPKRLVLVTRTVRATGLLALCPLDRNGLA